MSFRKYTFLRSLPFLLAFLLNGCAADIHSRVPSGSEKKDPPEHPMIRVETPRPGDIVRSPMEVRGEARGPWYFEGDFPLLLKGADGKILGRGFASARGAWMTTDFVPFSGTLRFAAPPGAEGWLILRKDNPSGLRELDDAVAIPVRFE